MRFKFLTGTRVCAALGLFLLTITSANPAVFAQERGVGGVEIKRNAGPYEIFIAEDVSKLAVGVVIVTVSLRDASTGEGVPGALVTIRTRHARTGEEGYALAVNYVSLTSYEAQVKLSTPGTWEITVDVESPLGNVSVEGLPVNIQTVRGLTSGSFVFVGVSALLILGVGYVWWSARREKRRRASVPTKEERVEEDGETGP